MNIIAFSLFFTILHLIFINCKLLRDESRCNLSKLCADVPERAELDMLECVRHYKVTDFPKDCPPIIKEHARIFFRDENLHRTLNNYCYDELKGFKCESSQKFIFCLLEQKDKINEHYCLHIIERVEFLLTVNFGFVSEFSKICEKDIEKNRCDVKPVDELALTVLEDRNSIALDCLQEHIDTIGDENCKKEILHISEIQGENMKLDTKLRVACVDDGIKFCSGILNGTNFQSIYKCLQEYISDPSMSEKCQEQILKREKLVAKDTKVSKGLVRACRDDIKAYKCRRMTSDDKSIRLAQILLCLENAVHNGSKITPACRSEMIRHRKVLMEDYRLSPEVVSGCSNDIENFCRGMRVGGKTIHCLFERSRIKGRRRRVSAQCKRALEGLIKVTDAGEDWRVDPVLRDACESVVRNLCTDAKGGGNKVMSCLMDNINSEYMKRNCSTALMQIQYFIARNFKLDPQLYSACHEDAMILCHAKSSWNDDPNSTDPERGPIVLPCLYRYVYNKNLDYKLKSKCEEEVKRVMRQRAVSVELIPEIEDNCLDDLALYCTDKTGQGEEMSCLQDKYIHLKPKCKVVVGNFTEAEAADINLNPTIKTYCRQVIAAHCNEELQNIKDDTKDVMDCLIRHKNDADVKILYKCRAAIEHFQIISLNDYHFTVAFKEACRPYVIRYCPKAHTKAQVVECLSEVIQNDTLKDEKHKLSKECRYQLRGQLLQQRELVDLDPKLKSACDKDMKTICNKSDLKSSQVLECLLEKLNSLSPACHKVVFRIEQHDFTDSSSDYTLLTTCKQMIKEYCKEIDTSQALTCLKKFKDEPVFDSNCRSLVLKRMVEQSADYRLNPALQRGCSPDIGKFCFSVLKNHLPDLEFEGKILHCLKVKFRERKLRKDCEKQLSIVLKESALNYKLNPLLRNLCTTEIRDICASEVEAEENGSSGKVEECLKVAFVDGRITNRACRLEVAGLIEEAKADIHVDPILHQACALDITKYCIDVPQGAGRVLQCLETVLSLKKALQPDCKFKLTQRIEMFKNAEPLINSEPKNFQELMGHVSRSPSKKYFVATLFSLVGIIFMLGLFCGRVTRRSTILKNK